MQAIQLVNVLFAPVAALLLVLFDYKRSKATDQIQRRVILCTIGCVMGAILFEFMGDTSAGTGAQPMAVMLIYSLYFVFQSAAFCMMVAFFDYAINRSATRLTNIVWLIGILEVIHVLVLMINLPSGFYYYVDANNAYVRGEYYAVRLLFAAFPAILMLVDLMLSRKNIRRNMGWLVLLSAALILFGGILDVAILVTRLTWPCFCTAILLIYLFIVRSDYGIDSLTGINNRRSCDEYLYTITRMNKRKPFTFVMIDMVRFKDINDTYGHAEGDVALKNTAQLLRRSIRQLDFVARYGGDEFLMLAVNCRLIEPILLRVKKNFDEYNANSGKPYRLELTIGAATYEPDDQRSPSEFLEYVDQLMYAQKGEQRRGREQSA